MINWRDGKAGFVGAAKRLIKGVFSYQHSVTSIAVDAPDAYHSLLSPIVSRGIGVLSTITTTSGVLSTVTATSGLNSPIVSRGNGLLSTVDDTGKGVLSPIKNTS